jgi:cytoskeleton protein RodZ
MPEMGPEIGATLRETRMRARIDIGEVEMRTKIRAKYLRAIENEEWDLLPGPVYVKSFLRTYAECLDLDARALLDEYKRRYELAPDARPLSAVKRDRERERERSNRRRRGTSIPSWAIVLVVLIAAGAALYFIGRGHGSSAPKAARGVVRTTTHSVTAPVLTHTTGATTRTTVTAVRTRATLKLVPTGAVWVCVETPAGTKLIDGVVEAVGTQIPALSGSELLVTLGNANMTVTGDGKPYKLTASATAIGFKVTAQGVTALPEGPTCA